MATESQIYYIPTNYIDEKRILQGAFKLRNVIEAGVLGGACALVSLLIPIEDINTRISTFIFFAMPGFLVGILGYNGDPISSALSYIAKWLNNKEIKLYNPTPRILKTSPTADVIDAEKMGDKLVDIWEAYREKKLQEKASVEYVEGKTFVFAVDPYIDDYTGQPMSDEEYEAYIAKMEQEKERKKDREIRVVSRSDLSVLDDIKVLDDDDDYLSDKS